ncbi:MAG: hypothetical protein B7Y84_10400 [Azorhizobium sp. 32-67-21]|nr:MAG: hypothetical protein B7Z30_08080 [Rhizobiales bacterium 12-68-15]OYX87821.1 MAG: hypothetical protein B7Y84_10400 [Azorhizobium sp. 32-67-21]
MVRGTVQKRQIGGRDRAVRGSGVLAGALRSGVPLVWFLCWLVLSHLVLGGVAAGAAIAASDGSTPVCSLKLDSVPDEAPASHGSVHCILCPLAGGTPPLPEPLASLVPPQEAFGPAVPPPVAVALAPPQAEPHKQARPRAPPCSAPA